ncbi:MAG TPA: hypothetical protein VGF24_11140 [Vicinamibacterales bacterium]|jgi:hypothetical protein
MKAMGSDVIKLMFRWVPVAVLAAVVVAVPRPATAGGPPPSEGTSGVDLVEGTHATRGIVQAIDAHAMVIARSRSRGSMTFTLTPSTFREERVVVGSAVSVRYREKDTHHVAVAIALERVRIEAQRAP